MFDIEPTKRELMNRRREVAGRVIALWEARGFVLDANPKRLAQLWIDRVIDSAEMRNRYLIVLCENERAQNERAAREVQILAIGPAVDVPELEEPEDLVRISALPPYLKNKRKKPMATTPRRPVNPMDAAEALFKPAKKTPAAAAERRAVPVATETVSVRIDGDVLAFFQEDGPGWQDRINAALRKAMEASR
jgi:uncharacterized protein (DUF4415 family)